MRRVFGGHLSGLYKKLPCIVCELRENVERVPRGGRVYMCERPDVSEEFVTVLGLTRLNDLQTIVVRWDQLRFPEVRAVSAGIAERCWRGTREETQQAVEQIRERLAESAGSADPFAPDVEL